MQTRGNDLRLLKLSMVLIVVCMAVATGLLISLHFQLKRVLAQEAAPGEASQETIPSPVPAAAVPQPASKGSKPEGRQTPRPIVSKSRSAQAEGQVASSSPELAEGAPEPVAPPGSAATPQPSLVLPPASTPIRSTPQPEWENLTLPSGTILTVRLVGTLDSRALRPGDRFTAVLDETLFAEGKVFAPRGSTVEGKVLESQVAGRVSGVSELRLELDRLLLRNGQSVGIVTDSVTKVGETSRGQDVVKVGSGAAIGAVIGAIAGGGKGAAVGAATGAGATTTEVLLSRGKPVILAPETRLSFLLRAPVSVEMRAMETSEAFFSPLFPPSYGDTQRPRLRRRF